MYRKNSALVCNIIVRNLTKESGFYLSKHVFFCRVKMCVFIIVQTYIYMLKCIWIVRDQNDKKKIVSDIDNNDLVARALFTRPFRPKEFLKFHSCEEQKVGDSLKYGGKKANIVSFAPLFWRRKFRKSTYIRGELVLNGISECQGFCLCWRDWIFTILTS